MDKPLRGLPAVGAVLDHFAGHDLPRAVVTHVVRQLLDRLREERRVPEHDCILEEIREALEQMRARKVQRVINATGIVLHTNLGRAPLSANTLAALAEV